MENNLLPVGSIVKVRFDKGKYCITGFYPIDKKSGKVYDYAAVEYPIGLVNFENTVAFDSGRVKEVVKMGYQTEEDKEFRQEIYNEVYGTEKEEPNTGETVPKVSPIDRLDDIEKLDE